MAKKSSKANDSKSSSDQVNSRVSSKRGQRAAKTADVPVDDCDNESDEKWNLVHMIPKGEKTTCHNEKCNKRAVSAWASSIEPGDLKMLCKECQDVSFSSDEKVKLDGSAANSILLPEVVQSLQENVGAEGSNCMESISRGNAATDHESDLGADMISYDEGLLLSSHSVITTADTSQESADQCLTGEVETKGSYTKTDNSAKSISTGDNSGTTHTVTEDTMHDSSEAWELIQILSLSRLSQEGTIKCSSEVCSLAACTVWKSNLAPTEKWYSCIDCQEADFDGWPPRDELPLKHVDSEHMRVMTQKCTKQSKPTFPDHWSALSPTKATSSSNIIPSTVSPHPHSPHSASDQAVGSSRNMAKVSPMPPKDDSIRPPLPSNAAMAMHRKWQEAAEAAGGTGARIIVSKPAAKKLIFDMLHDSFRPMNITQIHTNLKAVVPSPVLKSCLTEMVDSQGDEGSLFIDSDDEDEGVSKSMRKSIEKSDQDPFSGSLLFKSGRNVNTSLYYVSHGKLENNGNGLNPHIRNELISEKLKSELDESNLKCKLAMLETHTTQLVSEPNNEEASATLEVEESVMKDLRENLVIARALKVNEKHKKDLKRRIEVMTMQWRKRRRICLDFLISMEESSDGMISAEKCLSGDGQIDIDSDKAAIRDAKAYASKKKIRKVIVSGQIKYNKKTHYGNREMSEINNDLIADENFIAVELNNQGCVCRIFLDD